MIGSPSIFNLNQPPKMRKLFAQMSMYGIFFANLINPSVIIFILYDQLPHHLLMIWGSVNLFLFFSRLVFTRALYLRAYEPWEQIGYLVRWLYGLTIINALLLPAIVWVIIIRGVDDLHIFIVTLTIMALTNGAVGTLVSIFLIYVTYVLLAIIPVFIAILYHGGELFNIFALLLLLSTTSVIMASFRHFILLRTTSDMEDTFMTIYNKSADGIVLMEENRFTDCNEAFVEMFHCDTKDELMQKTPVDLMPRYQPDGILSIKKMFSILQRTQQQGISGNIEWLHHRCDGETFWAEFILRKIHLHDRELIHGIWRDVTERKMLEDERRQSRIKIEKLNQTLEQRVADEVKKNREMDHYLLQQSRLAQMGEMISMIAHQWRQPLSAITATSGLMINKAKKNQLDTATAVELSQKISNYAQHLSETINDFRNFFKPHTGKGMTSYDEIVHSVLDIIGISLSSKEIDLQTDLQCHDTFSCYPNELKQVLLNLIKNAEDALIENAVKSPYIRITSYCKEEQFVLEISDNGGGIDAKVLPYIFDPYFSTKNDKNGTGLGLYMSKIIIEEHCNGTLHAHNQGEGACFTIALSNLKEDQKALVPYSKL